MIFVYFFFFFLSVFDSLAACCCFYFIFVFLLNVAILCDRIDNEKREKKKKKQAVIWLLFDSFILIPAFTWWLPSLFYSPFHAFRFHLTVTNATATDCTNNFAGGRTIGVLADWLDRFEQCFQLKALNVFTVPVVLTKWHFGDIKSSAGFVVTMRISSLFWNRYPVHGLSQAKPSKAKCETTEM